MRVADRYGVSTDKVQELQDRAAGFAAKVAAFCERTGHSCLEMLIAKFQVCLQTASWEVVKSLPLLLPIHRCTLRPLRLRVPFFMSLDILVTCCLTKPKPRCRQICNCCLLDLGSCFCVPS
jgi:hypothetical protein